MAIWNTLEAQFEPQHLSNPALKPYHHAFLKLRNMPEDLRAFRAKTEEPGTLSAKGILEAVRSHAAKQAAPDLRRQQYRLAQAAQKLAAKRKALSVPDFDKADVVGAMMRAEIRTHLRSLDEARRTALLSIKPSSELVAAVFEAPDFLTGISGELRNRIETAFIETHHPNKLAAIEQEAELVDVVGMAFQTSATEIREALDFRTEHDFRRWLVGVTPEVDREVAGSGGKGVAPDVDVVVEMAASLSDINDRLKVSEALFSAA